LFLDNFLNSLEDFSATHILVFQVILIERVTFQKKNDNLHLYVEIPLLVTHDKLVKQYFLVLSLIFPLVNHQTFFSSTHILHYLMKKERHYLGDNIAFFQLQH